MKLILSLGTNIGDKEKNLNKAIELIKDKIGSVIKISSFYDTEPVGFLSDNKFLNAVIEVKTKLGVYRVLKNTQRIEKIMGRKEKSHNSIYKDRIIDIDIIYYSDLKIKNKTLTIPHPKMHERDFVMTPLKEIRGK